MPLSKQVSSSQPFWTTSRIALTTLTLSLSVIIGVTSCNSTDEAGRNPAPVVKTNPVKPAPAPPAALAFLPSNVLEASLQAASGPPIRLANYSGKVLIVNLWATWCGPCRTEIPELVKLQTEYRSKGLEIVGLSTEDPEASAEGVQEFVKKYQMNYKVGWATNEFALTLMQGRDAIPQSFVIGRDGRIVRRFVGFNANTTPPLIKIAVEEALKG